MLGLKLATDPRWALRVQQDLAFILTDHAYCEQKAASNAISLILAYPQLPDLVSAMAEIAQEEMDHFARVHKLLCARGYTLGPDRKDPYVNELLSFVRKGHSKTIQLTDRLCFAAMIEARSCERFRILSEHLPDAELSAFYRELMASEAGHYATFIRLARQYGEGVDVRWPEWLDYEASVIARYGVAATMHG